MNDADLAARTAEAAGHLLLELRATGLIAGKALGKAGDLAANALIVAALKQWRPDDGLLSEETRDTPERLGKSRVWIVDPLDGTREYGEGRDDWAVHVALAVDGMPVVGAVALPGKGLVLRSDHPPRQPLRAERPRLLVSRTRPPAIAEAVAKALDAEKVPMGSAGAKAMAVVTGEADLYLHAGGQHEWDNCAPAAVALAAGLHASRVDGSPLVYNQADTSMPDILICHREAAAELLGLVSRLGASIEQSGV
jgi:3'(2'), 5'-bisphosphate nucleotidase